MTISGDIDIMALAEEVRDYLEGQHSDLRVGIISAHPANKLDGHMIMLNVQRRQKVLLETSEDGGRR